MVQVWTILLAIATAFKVKILRQAHDFSQGNMRGLVGESHKKTLVLLFDVVLAGNLQLLALLRLDLLGQKRHAGVFAGAHELVTFFLFREFDTRMLNYAVSRSTKLHLT